MCAGLVVHDQLKTYARVALVRASHDDQRMTSGKPLSTLHESCAGQPALVQRNARMLRGLGDQCRTQICTYQTQNGASVNSEMNTHKKQ